ncbi:transporter, partial [gut metagenome]
MVPSAMTPRENIIYFTLEDTEEMVRSKISTIPYNRFLICDKDLDHIIGYVDSMQILRQILNNKPISFKEPGLVQSCPFIPDSLTLSEVLDVFQRSRSDFAVIINEYAMVVGVITLNDVMSTVMGELVITEDELQIIER